MRLPEGDRISESKARIKADLVVAMGGRIAEEMVFGEEKITTGASMDIKMATDRARRMVTVWGMSERLGTLAYGENQEEVFLGHSVARQQNVSEATAQAIDEEMRRIVDEAYGWAREILTDNEDELHTLAKALLEYETLTGDEINALLRGEEIHRDEGGGPSADATTGEGDTERGRRSSVPTSGSGIGRRPKPSGGMDPEPQTGS